MSTAPVATTSGETLVSSEVMIRLEKLFGDVCDELRVEGDEPLLLIDPGFVYVTQNANHQLFSVEVKDGVAAGRREHVALVEQGQLLCALPASSDVGEPTAFLLSGAAGSQVIRIPSKAFIEALVDPARQAAVEPLFDGWIRLLIATLPTAPVPTRCETVDPDLTLGPIELPIRSREGVVWIQLARTPSRFGGVRLGELDDVRPHVWPLTETTWVAGGAAGAALSSRAPSSIQPSEKGAWSAGARTSKSGPLVIKQRSTRFAEEFYAFVVAFHAQARLELERVRVGLDTASRNAEQEFLSDAFHQLALVGRGERLDEAHEEGNRIELATRRIAAFLNIPTLYIPWPEGHGRPNLGRIQTAISQVTSVRTRRVLLEGAWHTHDSGALLGFKLDDGDDVNDDRLTPVALLPGRFGYEMHDGQTEAPTPVDDAVAHRLHPQAYQFYSPLPDKPLTPLDVLRFSTRRSWRDVLFVVAVGMGLGSISTLIPLLTGQVFDNLIPGAERALLLQLTIVLALVYIGQALFDLARGFVMVRAQTRMDATLEAGVWDRMLSLPLPFFRQYTAGDLASRAAGIGGIREVLAGTTLTALLGGLFSLWNFFLLFAIDGGLAGAATVLVVIAIVPAVLGTHFGLKRQRAVAAIDGKIAGLLLQLLSGIAKLRVTAAENRAFAVWARHFARRRDADLGAERVNVRIAVFQSVYPIVCSIVLYWMLVGAAKQKVSTGMFLAFATAFGMFLASTLHVIEACLMSLSVIPLYERAKPILTTRVESQGTGERIKLSGGIEVNHVSFRYDPNGPLILDDVSFHIEPDEFVALVGPSGSGKSTLLRLMLGFENCSAGGIFYDGQALSNVDVRAVRKQIGVVMQNSRVMGGDIYSNIIGSTGLTIDDAWTAARSAALDKDIEAMPMGMHTVISQGGGTLSGGQKQRLLIARALATNPRIVFFDEATSALDNVTQAAVSESLESLHVTRIVIAHRLSTIRHADRIIVMEKGRVVQIGRYDDLVAVEGAFQKLAKRQIV
jgi:ATP-binding cassette subfamily C protein